MYKFDIFTAERSNQELIVNTLISGISHSIETKELENMLYYVIDNKAELFSDSKYKEIIFEGDEESISDLILPCVRKVFSKVYIDPPDILKRDRNLYTNLKDIKKSKENPRYTYFKLLFNIDEFLEYFIEIIDKVKLSLENFTYIDRLPETLSLITDNYIGILLKRIRDINWNNDEYILEIQKLKRERNLNKIING